MRLAIKLYCLFVTYNHDIWLARIYLSYSYNIILFDLSSFIYDNIQVV